MAAQLLLVGALIPTLRDRPLWPHKTTCEVTCASLAAMTLAFGSLGLWLATGAYFKPQRRIVATISLRL